MKKTLLILTAVVCAFAAKSQTIIGDCTDLSGDCLYYVSENIIVTNAEKSKGFTFHPSCEMKNGQLACSGIIAQLVNVGSCCEKNTLIILLDDGSKVMLTSWNKFNCEGNAYFNITRDEMQLLREHKMVKAQIKNGFTYDSFVNDISEKNQEYFFRYFKEIDANQFTPRK
jgi:hypothetical protein